MEKNLAIVLVVIVAVLAVAYLPQFWVKRVMPDIPSSGPTFPEPAASLPATCWMA